jgi:large subunit ribosomal protein L18
MAIKSKNTKMTSRQRTKYRIRKRLSGTEETPRISVFKSLKHTYAQVVSDTRGVTIASASTLDPEVLKLAEELSAREESKDRPSSRKSVIAARAVGLTLARRVREKQVEAAVFDRNGYGYMGRVQAVAEGAREGGLKF